MLGEHEKDTEFGDVGRAEAYCVQDFVSICCVEHQWSLEAHLLLTGKDHCGSLSSYNTAQGVLSYVMKNLT